MRLFDVPAFKSFVALSGTQLVGRGIRFLYLVVVARFLPPEQVGLYVYGIAFYLAFQAVADFGQGPLLASRIGRSRAAVARFVGHSLTAKSAVALATLLVALAVAAAVVEEGRAAIFLFAMTIPVRGVVHWVRQCAVAMEEATWIPVFETRFRAAEVVVGALALALGGGVTALAAVHLAVWAAEAVASVRRIAGIGGFSLRPGTDRRLLRWLFVASVPAAVAVWMTQLVYHAGVIGLRHVQADTAIVGQFGIAMQIVVALLMVPQSFAVAYLPALSRGDRHGGRQIPALQLVLKLVVFGGGGVGVAAAAYGPGLVALALGDDYRPAGEALGILCWGLGAFAVATLLIQSLLALNRRAQAAAIGAAMVVVNVVGLVLLSPFGALAAATASLSIAVAVGFLAADAAFQRRVEEARPLWWAVPLALVGAAAALVYGLPFDPRLTAPIVLAGLVVGAWRSGVVTEAERMLLAEALRRRVGARGS